MQYEIVEAVVDRGSGIDVKVATSLRTPISLRDSYCIA